MVARNPFRWSPKTGQYVRTDGRFVPRAEVRGWIDSALAAESSRATTLAEDLRRGKVSLTEWRAEMRGMIKAVHIYDAALAKGGLAQLGAADYGRVGQIVRQEYAYLEKFAADLASGAQPLDGRVAARAQMYAQAGRFTYHQVERTVMADAGYTTERNVLHPADHCPGCLGETARGRVPLGDLLPIGARDCGRRCKCTISYD